MMRPRVSYMSYDIADRERFVLLGTLAGLTARDLAIRIGVTARQVVRIRRRLRERGDL